MSTTDADADQEVERAWRKFVAGQDDAAMALWTYGTVFEYAFKAGQRSRDEADKKTQR